MTMDNIGIVILIVLLVPTLFQAVMINIRQNRGRREILDKLNLLEQKLRQLAKEKHSNT
jgi:hypothetical protein